MLNFIAAAVFDVLVVILTIYRMGRLALRSRAVGMGNALSYILFRDGE